MSSGSIRLAWRAAGAVAARPGLWPIAVVQLKRLAPRGWWRRPPFLPLPDRAYLRFRMQTAYGDPDHVPDGDDVVAYLEWCRTFTGWSRAGHRSL